ncbi:hypothetical protein IJJ12_00800, partial [bacterium]|nr:hypothetical protein [bacterium]
MSGYLVTEITGNLPKILILADCPEFAQQIATLYYERNFATQIFTYRQLQAKKNRRQFEDTTYYKIICLVNLTGHHWSLAQIRQLLASRFEPMLFLARFDLTSDVDNLATHNWYQACKLQYQQLIGLHSTFPKANLLLIRDLLLTEKCYHPAFSFIFRHFPQQIITNPGLEFSFVSSASFLAQIKNQLFAPCTGERLYFVAHAISSRRLVQTLASLFDARYRTQTVTCPPVDFSFPFDYQTLSGPSDLNLLTENYLQPYLLPPAPVRSTATSPASQSPFQSSRALSSPPSNKKAQSVSTLQAATAGSSAPRAAVQAKNVPHVRPSRGKNDSKNALPDQKTASRPAKTASSRSSAVTHNDLLKSVAHTTARAPKPGQVATIAARKTHARQILRDAKKLLTTKATPASPVNAQTTSSPVSTLQAATAGSFAPRAAVQAKNAPHVRPSRGKNVTSADAADLFNILDNPRVRASTKVSDRSLQAAFPMLRTAESMARQSATSRGRQPTPPHSRRTVSSFSWRQFVHDFSWQTRFQWLRHQLTHSSSSRPSRIYRRYLAGFVTLLVALVFIFVFAVQPHLARQAASQALSAYFATCHDVDSCFTQLPADSLATFSLMKNSTLLELATQIDHLSQNWAKLHTQLHAYTATVFQNQAGQPSDELAVIAQTLATAQDVSKRTATALASAHAELNQLATTDQIGTFQAVLKEVDDQLSLLSDYLGFWQALALPGAHQITLVQLDNHTPRTGGGTVVGFDNLVM